MNWLNSHIDSLSTFSNVFSNAKIGKYIRFEIAPRSFIIFLFKYISKELEQIDFEVKVSLYKIESTEKK